MRRIYQYTANRNVLGAGRKCLRRLQGPSGSPAVEKDNQEETA